MTRPWSHLRFSGALLLSLALLSCGGSDSQSPPDDGGDPVTSVSVSPSEADIDIGGTTTLTATVRTQSGADVTSSSTVTWSSTATSVASVVGNGATAVVTGEDDGTATIRATASGRTGSATITVTDPDPPAAPSSVTAIPASDTEIDLGWSDDSDNEEVFRIEREEVTAGSGGGSATGPAATFTEVTTVGANTTSYRDGGLDPTASYRYLVRACNANGCTPEPGSGGEGDATSEVVTTHATLVLETTELPSGVVNQAYEATLEASGGDGGHDFDVSAGQLPSGLSLSSDGVLGGTPDEVGESTFTVEVVSGEQVVSREFTVEISEEPDPPEISTSSLPDGVVGTPYSENISAIKGDGENYEFAIVGGGLPSGLSMDAAGQVSGTPTAAGQSTFTVEVTSNGETGSRELTLDVHEALEANTGPLSTGVEGVAYEETLTATGGVPPYVWMLTDGSLPAGLDLASDGTITGTPSVSAAASGSAEDGPAAVGTSHFTVAVTSQDGQVADAELSITIHAPLEITTTTLPDGQTGSAYSESVAASGGDASYTFGLSGGSLPPGLSVGSNGTISGTPSAAGTFTFTVQVTSGDGQSASAELSIEITPGPPTITTTSLPDGEVGTAYSRTLDASGGDGSFDWAVVAGDLPDGLGLDASTGEISGTPTAEGTSTFTVQVTSAAQTDDQELSITIASGVVDPVSLDTRFLQGGYPGVGYSDDVSASGGNGTFDYSVVGGALPPGLSLNANTGALTGSPTTSGVYYFTIEAESGGNTDRHTYAMAISTKGPSAFNLWVANGASANSIPSNAVLGFLSTAIARWEQVIVSDLADGSYGPSEWGPGECGGYGPIMNGQSFDDMVVLIDFVSIDGPSGTVARAGPCDGRVLGPSPAINTTIGQLRFDTDDLGNLSTTQGEALVFHEIGHVVGIGTWWEVAAFIGGTDLMSGSGGSDPRYEGAGGNGEFVNALGGGSAGATKIPIEADGGSGTAYGHWDEGEFDAEVMTGWIEGSSTPMPISGMTIAAVGDFAYSVNMNAADAYAIPDCAPSCSSAATAPGVGGHAGIDLGDDILRGPVRLELPDGRIIYVDLRSR